MARTKRPRRQKVAKRNTGNISARDSLRRSSKKLLANHNKAAMKGGKSVGKMTQKNRSSRFLTAMDRLSLAGYGIRNPSQLRESHVKVIVKCMEDLGLANSTISTTLSVLRVVSVWIGKEGMIGPTEIYVSDPGNFFVPSAATSDKSWESHGIDPIALIKKVSDDNPRAGIVLEVMHAFGIRLREAVLMKPYIVNKEVYIDIYDGTKGGRSRTVPIKTEYQREVLRKAELLAGKKRGNLAFDYPKLESWIRQCYRVFKKHGITKKDGIVPHGLRHGYLQDVYEEISGSKPPIRRGDDDPEPDKFRHYMALKEAAERAGHSRPSITSCYVGSTDPRVKKRQAREEQAKLDAAKKDEGDDIPVD